MKVISLRAAKYEKMYKNFYKNSDHRELGFFNKVDSVDKKKVKIS
jgi:hypothetical protein